ncbi:MAG: hypothetical protein OHK0040_00370 [bacterium]
MKFIVLILIAIVIAVFAVQNATVVSLSFFNYHFESSLVVVVLLSFALGIISGIVYMLPSLLKKHFQISGLKKELNTKEQSREQNVKSGENNTGF